MQPLARYLGIKRKFLIVEDAVNRQQVLVGMGRSRTHHGSAKTERQA